MLGRWIAVILAIAALVTLAATGGFWLPPLLKFLNAHEDSVDSLTKIVQSVFGALAVGVAIVAVLMNRRGGGDTATTVSVEQGSAVVTGEHTTVNVAPPAPLQTTGIASALHQLRQPVADFTGRRDVLERLSRVVVESGVAISGVRGMGGIGKTELALVLAHRLISYYPDAQIFLDLRGASDNPTKASEAMSHVIRAFDAQAQLPQDEGGLSALYYSTLSSKRALLLMDNASNAEQVEPLIPPAGCLLLVTSRSRFTLPGMNIEDVDAMLPGEARDLLLAIAPRIENHADAIADLCGYLPQALRLAGSALAARDDLTPEDYIDRLRNTATRLRELGEAYASIGTSYDLLSEELQRRFRLLAVFPETFDVAGAAAVWELESAQAQNALSDLRTYSLLEWSQATRRYHLHDLVRDFADSQMQPEERTTAGQRHSAYYGEILDRAANLFRQGGNSTLPGLGLFDTETGNIRAGQRWAADNRGADSAATVLRSTYASVGPSHEDRPAIIYRTQHLRVCRAINTSEPSPPSRVHPLA